MTTAADCAFDAVLGASAGVAAVPVGAMDPGSLAPSGTYEISITVDPGRDLSRPTHYRR